MKLSLTELRMLQDSLTLAIVKARRKRIDELPLCHLQNKIADAIEDQLPFDPEYRRTLAYKLR